MTRKNRQVQAALAQGRSRLKGFEVDGVGMPVGAHECVTVRCVTHCASDDKFSHI